VSDRLALANAIEDAGIPRDKAERVASVIFDAIHDNVATKADVQASEAAIRGDLRTVEAALRSEIVAVRSALASETARLDTRIERLDAKVEQIGSRTFNRLGSLMVVLSGIIIAAMHYWPPGHG
jgi:hypothetical protein